MADRATGPVKPPVIDLTARNPRPEGEARPSPPPPPPPQPRGRLRFDLGDANWPLLVGIAAAGAVLGTLLTYVLATALPLPARPQPVPAELTAQLTDAKSRLDAMGTDLAAVKAAAQKTDAGTAATASKLESDIAAVNTAIAAVKSAIPAAPPAVDLSPLEAEIKTLKDEVAAVAAGAPGTDANTIAQNLTTLQTSVQSLTARLDGVDGTLGTLRSDLDATRKALNDHISAALPNEVGPALKLPLILSGLEDAFANGRPFAAELAALKGVLPDVAVPASLTATAATGLSRPDALMQEFETVMPDILAARSSGSGDWVNAAGDWLKALLAVRPASETPGAAPDAVASRLEAAMGRRDYAAAAALLGQLPAPMQQAAAPVEAGITAHADADRLVNDLRTRALGTAQASQ
jgi:hypothetical protein